MLCRFPVFRALVAGLVVVVLSADGAAPRAQAPTPHPCAQVLSDAEVAKVLGAGLTRTVAVEEKLGESMCAWTDDGTGSAQRRVMVTFVDKRAFATSSPQAAYDAYVATLGSTYKAEPLPGIGEQAALLAFPAPAVMVAVRRADGFVRVAGLQIGREKTIELAKIVASAPAPRIPAAGEVRPRQVPQPEMPEAIELTDDVRGLSCMRLLTGAEITAAAGDGFRLTGAGDPRPGISFCEWKAPAPDVLREVNITVRGREEFAAAGKSTAAEYYALETSMVPGPQVPDALRGIGDQATLVAADDTAHSAIVRRGDEVLTMFCQGCSRAQAVALVRAAAAR